MIRISAVEAPAGHSLIERRRQVTKPRQVRKREGAATIDACAHRRNQPITARFSGCSTFGRWLGKLHNCGAAVLPSLQQRSTEVRRKVQHCDAAVGVAPQCGQAAATPNEYLSLHSSAAMGKPKPTLQRRNQPMTARFSGCGTFDGWTGNAKSAALQCQSSLQKTEHRGPRGKTTL